MEYLGYGKECVFVGNGNFGRTYNGKNLGNSTLKSDKSTDKKMAFTIDLKTLIIINIPQIKYYVSKKITIHLSLR